MIHRLKQQLPEVIGQLPEPTQNDIISEKSFRRASPEFAYKNGGELVRLFLDILDSQGLVNDRSRLMCQCSPTVKGTYPSPPNWHVDRMPGTKFNLIEHITQPITGAIVSICSKEFIETTEFISEGEIVLDEPSDSDLVHQPNQYFDDDQGLMNWTTSQIEAQLDKGTIKKANIEANTIYDYDSTYFHKCPEFVHDGGYRIILRVNTAPEDFAYDIATRNEIIKEREYFFRLSEDRMSWKKFAFEGIERIE